jgi:hypothetical protein
MPPYLRTMRLHLHPLEQAIGDPASADTYIGPAGITWIHRWAIMQGRPGSSFAGGPTVPARMQKL